MALIELLTDEQFSDHLTELIEMASGRFAQLQTDIRFDDYYCKLEDILARDTLIEKLEERRPQLFEKIDEQWESLNELLNTAIANNGDLYYTESEFTSVIVQDAYDDIVSTVHSQLSQYVDYITVDWESLESNLMADATIVEMNGEEYYIQ